MTQYTEKPLLHFSFLRDIKVHGIYYNSLKSFLCLYPLLKKEHYHDFYTVILFTKGSGQIKVKNDNYTIREKTICLIGPDQIHSYDGMENMEGIVFLFCQDFYVEEFSFIRLLNVFSFTSHISGGSNHCIDLSENEYDQASDILKLINREYDHFIPGNNSAIVLRSLLNIFLLKLSDLYESKLKRSNGNDSTFIHELSRTVDFHFIREHNISFYTAAFNVSEKQLNEICNKNFNCSLKKIIVDRLMQEARKLLLSSELSVSEISYKLNFEDNSYFNKVFKKQTGLTPRRFREIHKRFIP